MIDGLYQVAVWSSVVGERDRPDLFSGDVLGFSLAAAFGFGLAFSLGGLGLACTLRGCFLGFLPCGLLAEEVFLVEVLDVLAHRLGLLVEHLDFAFLVAYSGQE